MGQLQAQVNLEPQAKPIFSFFNRAAISRWRSCSARGLFFYFFLVLSVTRRRPPLSQVLVGTLNHATCNVYSPKSFWNINTRKCYRYCSLHCVQNIFSFGFIKALDLKEIRSCLLCRKWWSLTHWSQRFLRAHVKIYIFPFERSMKRPFPRIFFLQDKQKSLITNHAKLTLCKECNQKLWLWSDVSISH